MEVYIIFTTFVLGLVIGSFTNMLVYRLHISESILGRSYCDHNRKALKPIDLIPLVSFIIFKGKCRECKKKIPLLYPVVELLFGICFAFLGYQYLLQFGSIAGFAVGVIFVFFQIFYAVDDYLHWELDARMLYFGIGAGLLINLISLVIPLEYLNFGWQNIIAGAIGGAFIWLVIRLSNGGGMGEGDIYLMIVSGLFLGYQGLIFAFFLATVTGSIVGLIKAAKVKKFKGTKIQLAPFIALGSILSFFFQNMFWQFMTQLILYS